MHNKIIIALLSIIVIISCAYFKTIKKEPLTNNNYIVLMGDSVLNNSNYVPSGKSVADNIQNKFSNLLNVAKDGATLSDLYRQLDNIPAELNKDNTYIFISAGGNDILKTRQTNKEIATLFQKYTEFIKTLRTKLPSAKINILNLYLPTNPRYQSYKTAVEQWNQLISTNATKVGESYNVLDLNALLNSPEDFVYDIEPSEIASTKIANHIYLTR